MKKIIPFIILASLTGWVYAQSNPNITAQQAQDLQGQIADDTVTVTSLNQQLQFYAQTKINCDAATATTTAKRDAIQQRIDDAQAVLSQANAT